MRWLAVTVLAIAGCGESTSAAADARVPPVIDAGTGDCRDDYAAASDFCQMEHGELDYSCARFVVDRYETCIGAARACQRRCTFDRNSPRDGGTFNYNTCLAQCPEAGA